MSAKSVNFFSRYQNYLMLVAHSENAEDLLQWGIIVKFRIKRLIAALLRRDEVAAAKLNPYSYRSTHLDINDWKPFALPGEDSDVILSPHNISHGTIWFIGLEFRKETTDFAEEIAAFVEDLARVDRLTGICHEEANMVFHFVTKKDLPKFIAASLLPVSERARPLKRKIRDEPVVAAKRPRFSLDSDEALSTFFHALPPEILETTTIDQYKRRLDQFIETLVYKLQN